MSERYHEGSRRLQDRNDTRRLADRLAERIHSDVISDHDKAFIERQRMFFLATADAEGGILVVDPASGDTLYSRNADKVELCLFDSDGTAADH